jgi:hypothetical protein
VPSSCDTRAESRPPLDPWGKRAANDESRVRMPSRRASAVVKVGRASVGRTRAVRWGALIARISAVATSWGRNVIPGRPLTTWGRPCTRATVAGLGRSTGRPTSPDSVTRDRARARTIGVSRLPTRRAASRWPYDDGGRCSVARPKCSSTGDAIAGLANRVTNRRMAEVSIAGAVGASRSWTEGSSER